MAIDADHELALDDGPGFLLRVLMLMHIRRARFDVVAREGHPLTVSHPALPARNRLDLDHLGHSEQQATPSRQAVLVSRTFGTIPVPETAWQ